MSLGCVHFCSFIIIQFRATPSARRDAPEKLDRGAAVTHDNTAYFTPYNSHTLFKYQVDEDKWTTLPPCPHANFGLAFIHGLLTVIGGINHDSPLPTCTLLSFEDMQWVEKLPPMTTPRSRPAVAATPGGAAIVAAGGWGHDGDWWSDAVELYDSDTSQWSTLLNLPERLPGIAATLCGDRFYVMDWSDSVYSCSLQSLIAISQIRAPDKDYPKFWEAVPNVPVKWCTLASVCGRPVAVGGHTKPDTTSAIHLYDGEKWMCIGHMATARKDSIVAVLPEDKMLVVGGLIQGKEITDVVEMISITCV